ncbi:MAG: CRTAC1 family protein [Planctomycetes bacterium]|nr:CRTAC1 family protein [Planctomycetota bacterium]
MTQKPRQEEPAVLKDGVEYEEVTHDDQVIGRAFRASLVVIGVGLAAGGGIYWWTHRAQALAPVQVVTPEAPKTIQHDVQLPEVRFRDVTAAAGITFAHQNGAEGDKLLPETMGGGSAFFDLEGDGDVDLLLVNSCNWPESQRGDKPTQALYTNDGRGQFTNATAESGLGASFYGMGAACADADSDGDTDVFFTAVGPNHLFVNEGGRFSEHSDELAGAADAWSTCATFFDADSDGDLDLYVGNYVHWSRAIDLEVNFTLSGIGRAYGPPTTFEGSQPYFYANQGDGHFLEVSKEAGLHVVNPATGVPVGKALGARANDPDMDGDLDLMIANDTVANFFYRNKGAGSFEERAREFGLAFDKSGLSTGAMGIDAAWFRNDNTIAYAIGNFANEMSSFYVSQGRADLWADEAIGTGIGAPTRKYLKFGTLFLDYDLDGRLDYLQANGHLESEISQVQASQTYQQPAQLFWNAGNEVKRTFVEVGADASGDLSRPIVGRGCSTADIDGDGDLDVLLTQSGGKPVLLQNEQALGHHWLRVRLSAKGKNHAAIGARVELFVNGVKQCQDAVPFKSYLSQCEATLTFGLGAATKADKLVVTWPDGAHQELAAVAADRVLDVRQE